MGEIEVSVRYGQACDGSWLSPLRQLLGLTSTGRMSPLLEEQLCYAAVRTGSYQAAAEVAHKFGVASDDSTIQRHVAQAGRRARVLEQARVERALEPSTRGEVVEQASKQLQGRRFSMVIEIDGWMRRERDEQWGVKPAEQPAARVAWHEVKTAKIFRLEDRGHSLSGRAFVVESFSVAYRGDAYEFGRRVHSEALRRGLVQAERVWVVADGAAWIWNLVEDRFQQAIGVLDFYHAAQHLWAVAQALYPDDGEQAGIWVKPLLHNLRHGRCGEVIGGLEGWLAGNPSGVGAQVAADNVSYLKSHTKHMDYPQAQAHGCPVGSGGVESQCAQLQNRFKRTGQFWSRAGGDELLMLEIARRNGDWDEIFYPPGSLPN